MLYSALRIAIRTSKAAPRLVNRSPCLLASVSIQPMIVGILFLHQSIPLMFILSA